jgi:hypothetical protein
VANTSGGNDIVWANNKFVAVGGLDYNANKMVYSADGVTWTAVTNTTFSNRINGVAWGNNKFVAVGSNGKMAYSSDGVTWTAVADSTFGGDTYIQSIAWGNNKFVAVGQNGKMAYSSN